MLKANKRILTTKYLINNLTISKQSQRFNCNEKSNNHIIVIIDAAGSYLCTASEAAKLALCGLQDFPLWIYGGNAHTGS